MKHLSLSLAALCICVSGCRDGGTTANAAAESTSNAAVAVPETLVSGFADPKLAGMTVRDHPQGAQVVSPPSARKPQPSPSDVPSMIDMLPPRAVLTAVNDTRIRNAAHFRDLMNDAYAKKAEIKLSQLMFLVDEDNDGWATTTFSEPEGNTAPATSLDVRKVGSE